MIITAVGSRSTPANICDQMTLIGQWAKANNHLLRSGHAPGADYAFEKGAQQNCVVYLPWSRFNHDDPIVGCAVVPIFTAEITATVARFHPAPEKLTTGGTKLMARNSLQVLGSKLDKPSHALVCYRSKPGGTDQAIRIAEAHNIPILNMAEEQYSTAEKIIFTLEAINATR